MKQRRPRKSVSKQTADVKDTKPVSVSSALLSVDSIHKFSDSEVRRLRHNLLSWYDANKRDLPWRQITQEDVNQRAYAVWVSEIMLQQTQVATVIDYYNRWMAKWPTLEALAASSIEEVNEMWSGLGYYSRGRRLLEGAQKVVSELKGQMPATSQDLVKQLPGVGRYTAGAISSIAFDEVTGLVDGNVIRVFSRMRAIGAHSTRSDVMDAFWQLASDVVDSSRPGDFNQALMELGATVCTPKLVQCGKCPVRELCCAFRMNEVQMKTKKMKICSATKKEENGVSQIPDIECLVPDCNLCLPSDSPWDSELGVMNFPRKPKKSAVKQEELQVVILHTDKSSSKFFVCQRPDKGLLAGMWEFPTCDLQESSTELTKAVSKLLGIEALSLKGLKHVGEVSHVFSHIKHLYKVWVVQPEPHVAAEISQSGTQPVRWLTEDEMSEAALSTGMRKVFREFKKSTAENHQKKRKHDDDVIIKSKQTQASISDFFKKK